jgi:hypothetical protein
MIELLMLAETSCSLLFVVVVVDTITDLMHTSRRKMPRLLFIKLTNARAKKVPLDSREDDSELEGRNR